ncbi:MAG TPA: glucose 1-dehydrogenase [Rhizomicrobium sp.]
MGKLNNKVAVVTGASKGIGAGIAKALAAEGANVVVNYAGDKAGAEKVVAAIVAAGSKAVAVQADVAKAADVKRLFDETAKAFGKVDVLVNNAGVYNFVAIADVTESEFQRQFGTNVWGLLQTTQLALPHFNDGGSVINISSIVSQMSLPGSAIYAGTKGAVDTITRVLAAELAPRRIRVNSLNPGLVDSEGTQSAGIIGGEFETHVVSTTPLGRVGQPADIAKVAVFLASDDAGWVTGERLPVSGGAR